MCAETSSPPSEKVSSIRQFTPLCRKLNLIAPIFTISIYIPSWVVTRKFGEALLPGLLASLGSAIASVAYLIAERRRRRRRAVGTHDLPWEYLSYGSAMGVGDLLCFALHFTTLVLCTNTLAHRNWRRYDLLPDVLAYVVMCNSTFPYLYLAIIAVLDGISSIAKIDRNSYNYSISYCPHCGEHIAARHPAEVPDPVQLTDEEQLTSTPSLVQVEPQQEGEQQVEQHGRPSRSEKKPTETHDQHEAVPLLGSSST